jgi:hypothetical protein
MHEALLGLATLLCAQISEVCSPTLQYSITPSLRLVEVEDEDDDEESLPDEASGL